MRTQLSEFCKDFDRQVRPILAPLGMLIGGMGQADSALASAPFRGELNELRHQLQSLVSKVESQQAYVLIFGPLKSGKSTLMNAIASAYVSEVSALPAYPCLVFVSHGKKKEFLLTDYDGKTESFADSEDLQDRVEAAHSHLAASMRAVEETGESFDPQEHFTAAIRRVDVKVPAKHLAESGAVLVDTPGLYTRMRFGYDRMTQEFRSSAACAIFVVKSDTLFLEQVFAEFQQLLDLFSRIFLVVNMDTAKRDVGPDGKLIPSLEQRSPERIIQAFEDLAMTAPIKQAASEGRVRIYPVDLMSAASVTLKRTGTLPEGFIAFDDDLRAYLGSVDYLRAFLGDSLRRAQGLCGEVRRSISGTEVAELEAEAVELQSLREEHELELNRLSACLEHDWSSDLARFAEEIESELARRSSDIQAQLSRAMSAAIDTWFLSGHSLQWLIDKQWKPLIDDYRNEVQAIAMGRFEESCLQADAGVDLDPELSSLLHFFEIEIQELRRSAQATQGMPVWHALPKVLIDPGAIPIRRGLLNILALRGVDKVRQDLFGQGDQPDQKIAAKVKLARLGDPAKQHIRRALTQFQATLTRKTTAATRHRFCMALENATATEVGRRLRKLEPDLRDDLARIDRDATKIEALTLPVEQLRSVIEQSLDGLQRLSARYAETNPELLLLPLAKEAVVSLPAAPKRKGKSRKRGSKRNKRRSAR